MLNNDCLLKLSECLIYITDKTIFFTKLSEIERFHFCQISWKREHRLLILLHERESDKTKKNVFYNPIKNTLFFSWVWNIKYFWNDLQTIRKKKNNIKKQWTFKDWRKPNRLLITSNWVFHFILKCITGRE